MKKFDINEWLERHHWQVRVFQLTIALVVCYFIFPYYEEWQRNIDSWQRVLFIIGCLSMGMAFMLLGNKLRKSIRRKK